MIDIEEILALDLLTLCEHTEHAGDTLDPGTHRQALEKSMQISEVVAVRRQDELVAYAMLHAQKDACRFVTAFNTPPALRTAPPMRELLAGVVEVARRRRIAALRSNVYKTNQLSMGFHRRLGFRIMRENAKGVEFHATLKDLALNPIVGKHIKELTPCRG